MKFDFDKYPNTIFGFRDAEYVWEFDFKDNYLWLRDSTVWLVLKHELDLNYSDVQSLIKKEVEEHFKCGGVTLEVLPYITREKVEEHFKCGGVTPLLPDWRWKNISNVGVWIPNRLRLCSVLLDSGMGGLDT